MDYVKRRGEEFKETANETLNRSKESLRRHKENLAAAMDAGKQAYRDASADSSAD